MPKGGESAPRNERQFRGNDTRKSILVVEDEWDMADVLGELLREEGYLLRVVYDAVEAQVAVRMQRPDLAIVDRRLPIRDGLDLAHEFDDLGIPVIMISAQLRPAELREAIPFLPKPLDVQRLFHLVAEQVGR